jgi:hypothetical protein
MLASGFFSKSTHSPDQLHSFPQLVFLQKNIIYKYHDSVQIKKFYTICALTESTIFI